MPHLTINPLVFPESHFGADDAQPLPCIILLAPELAADAEGSLPRPDPRDRVAMPGHSLCPGSVAVPVASSHVLLGE